MDDLSTLREAKDFLKKEFKAGTICPCCGQFVKLYRYKLYDSSARALILLSRLGTGYHHVKEYAEASDARYRAAHFAELRFWGFIEKSDERIEGKKSAGFWSITDKGRSFVCGDLFVQEKVLIFNNTFLGFEGDMITIQKALGLKFDYDELMDLNNVI